jgi:hypothetical protein
VIDGVVAILVTDDDIVRGLVETTDATVQRGFDAEFESHRDAARPPRPADVSSIDWSVRGGRRRAAGRARNRCPCRAGRGRHRDTVAEDLVHHALGPDATSEVETSGGPESASRSRRSPTDRSEWRMWGRRGIARPLPPRVGRVLVRSRATRVRWRSPRRRS